MARCSSAKRDACSEPPPALSLPPWLLPPPPESEACAARAPAAARALRRPLLPLPARTKPS
eukprot:3354410-Pyramimonas_sp.AAC.1